MHGILNRGDDTGDDTYFSRDDQLVPRRGSNVIATLRYAHPYTIHDGTEVPVRNLAAFDRDLYIKRRRQKTLHQNGFETLCYRHAGRDFRLTPVAGHVVSQILA